MIKCLYEVTIFYLSYARVIFISRITGLSIVHMIRKYTHVMDYLIKKDRKKIEGKYDLVMAI